MASFLRTPRAIAGYGFYCRLSVCLSVFPHHFSQVDAARITKLDVEMIHDESCKPTYFGIKRTKVKVTRHTDTVAGKGHCTLVSAGCY